MKAENGRDCVVCGKAFTRKVGENDRLWSTRATCGRKCAAVLAAAPLGRYPTPLHQCASCGLMERPASLTDEKLCERCDRDALDEYRQSAAGLAFIQQCRSTPYVGEPV